MTDTPLTRFRRLLLTGLALSLFSLGACDDADGGDGDDPAPRDARADIEEDTSDVAADTSEETDTEGDVGPDTSDTSQPEDTGGDVTPDTSPDVAADASQDVTADTSADAASDTGADVSADTGADVSPDVASDTAGGADVADGGGTMDADGGAASDCLVIGEYIEGSGTDNKAIELYNCGGTTLALKNYGVCIAFNQDTSCGSATGIADVQLAPGEVHTLCRSKTGPAGDPVAGIKNNCDQEAGGTIRFNGNDRLLVFKDGDDNGDYASGPDEIADSFGKVGNPPNVGDSPWENTTYRRCDPTPYTGSGAFDVTSLYTSHPEDDASHFGTAPTSNSCP